MVQGRRCCSLRRKGLTLTHNNMPNSLPPRCIEVPPPRLIPATPPFLCRLYMPAIETALLLDLITSSMEPPVLNWHELAQQKWQILVSPDALHTGLRAWLSKMTLNEYDSLRGYVGMQGACSGEVEAALWGCSCHADVVVAAAANACFLGADRVAAAQCWRCRAGLRGLAVAHSNGCCCSYAV